mgnify:CR=1 FL=1
MNRTSIFRFAILALLTADFGLIAGNAFSQTYPNRPITFICPYAPGTGIDLIARIIGQKLSEYSAYPVVIKNQPGASGNIGAEAAANSPPDGYTIVIIANSHIINQHVSKNVRDVLKDFDPVALAGTLPYLLTVSSSLPANSIKELVALARSRPGEINYSGVVGSVPHLLGVMLKSAGNIDITLISYKSTTDAVADVVGGRVPIWFTTVASGLPFVKSGTVRALGISGEKRAALLPDVPTMVEAGFPGLNTGSEFYILAPAGTPKPIITKLNSEITKAMGTKDVKEKLVGQGVDPNSSTPEELGAILKNEVAKWAKTVKESGIRTE